MKSYGSKKSNFYLKNGIYNPKYIKRIIYYEMFQYLDFANYNQEIIDFLKEKKCF